MKRLIFAASMLLASPALAQELPKGMSKQEREAMALTSEQASGKTMVRGGDDLDPSLWITTEPFLSGGADDKFLRAMVDKATGRTIYQLYLKSTSRRGALRLSRMTYLVDGALRTATVERIGTDVSCRNGCAYFEDFIVELTRADIEALAKSNGTGDFYWRMRFFGDAVSGLDSMMMKNETAGFLIAVDRERSRLGFGDDASLQ